MYGIQAIITYPETTLIGYVFFFRFVREEPTDDDLSRVLEELREKYRGQPFVDLIQVCRPGPQVVQAYMESFHPGVGDVISDPVTCFNPDWRDDIRPPGLY